LILLDDLDSKDVAGRLPGALLDNGETTASQLLAEIILLDKFLGLRGSSSRRARATAGAGSSSSSRLTKGDQPLPMDVKGLAYLVGHGEVELQTDLALLGALFLLGLVLEHVPAFHGVAILQLLRRDIDFAEEVVLAPKVVVEHLHKNVAGGLGDKTTINDVNGSRQGRGEQQDEGRRAGTRTHKLNSWFHCGLRVFLCVLVLNFCLLKDAVMMQ